MTNELILFQTFDNAVQANIVKHKLLSENIQAFLHDENLISLNPLYSIAAGGIKLFVPADQFKIAQEIIIASEKEYHKNLCCEACGFGKVEFVLSRKDKKNFLAILISFVFTVVPIYQKKVYRCERCGYETEHLEEN